MFLYTLEIVSRKISYPLANMQPISQSAALTHCDTYWYCKSLNNHTAQQPNKPTMQQALQTYDIPSCHMSDVQHVSNGLQIALALYCVPSSLHFLTTTSQPIQSLSICLYDHVYPNASVTLHCPE